MPPPVHCGARVEPWRARPVPFWRHGLRPPPRTSARVLVECVPARSEARPAITTWCISGTFTFASNRSAGRSRSPTFFPARSRRSTFGIASGPLPERLLDSGPDHQQPTVRAGDGALDEQEVALRVHVHDLEVEDGDSLVAHLPGHAGSLEHTARRRACPDRSGRTVLSLRAVAGAEAG